MTRNEREELIRRYMAGDMSAAEEHDFFIQVALDNELRIGLKAHRTIDSAILKDREIDPAAYAPLQTHVAAMLAATRTAPPSPRGNPGGSGTGAGGWSWPGGSLLAALGSVGVMIGSSLATPFLPTPSAPSPRATVKTPAIRMAEPAAPTDIVTPPVQPMPAASEATSGPATERPIRNSGREIHEEAAAPPTTEMKESNSSDAARRDRAVNAQRQAGHDSTRIGIKTLILPPKK